MQVRLCVLSGSRRGECLEMTGNEFSIGGEPSCDVSFSPEKDPAAVAACAFASAARKTVGGHRVSAAENRC